MSQAEMIMQVEQTALTAQGSSVAAAIICCVIYFLFFCSAVHSFIATSEILQVSYRLQSPLALHLPVLLL